MSKLVSPFGRVNTTSDIICWNYQCKIPPPSASSGSIRPNQALGMMDAALPSSIMPDLVRSAATSLNCFDDFGKPAKKERARQNLKWFQASGSHEP